MSDLNDARKRLCEAEGEQKYHLTQQCPVRKLQINTDITI